LGSGSLEQHKQTLKGGLLWPYIRNVDAYHCPSDKRLKNPAHNNAWRTYSITGGMYGVPAAGDWDIIPYTRASQIKMPAEKYVFLSECDKRGDNMGSWVIGPNPKRTLQWVDPLGLWHRGNSNTLGFADGHADMQLYRGRKFIREWNYVAMYDPAKFNFFRNPKSSGEPEEMDDFQYMIDHYPYKSLFPPP
jgi:hypothetical protein